MCPLMSLAGQPSSERLIEDEMLLLFDPDFDILNCSRDTFDFGFEGELCCTVALSLLPVEIFDKVSMFSDGDFDSSWRHLHFFDWLGFGLA